MVNGYWASPLLSLRNANNCEAQQPLIKTNMSLKLVWLMNFGNSLIFNALLALTTQ